MVWAIYVLDRIGDARNRDPEIRERHRFHWRYRKILVPLVILVVMGCILGFVVGVPTAILYYWPYGIPNSLPAVAEAVFTHGFFVLFLTACFFVVSQSQGRSMESLVFKNSIAALTFAFGTAIGAHFYTGNGLLSMLISFEALGFAFLCLMNLNAIDLWEREEKAGEDYASRDYLLSLPLLVIGFLSLLAASFWHEYRKPFYYSMLVASASLLMLDHFRTRFSARLLRVLADVALLMPLPIFWFWFKN